MRMGDNLDRVRVDRAIAAENDGPLHDVLQFTNVARPIVHLQTLESGWRHAVDMFPEFGREINREVSRQLRDILPTLAQRRNANGEHAESVVQVLAKMSGTDLAL